MSHIPVNHPLRPVYRVAAALAAGWLLGFGAVGLSATQGAEWFARGDWTALGLSTNRAFSVVSLVAGAVVLLAVLVGRNVDRAVNLYGGPVFLVGGTVLLALSHTDANVFNASVSTTVAAYLVGMVMLTAGLYGKVTPAERAVSPKVVQQAEPASAPSSAEGVLTG